MNVTTEEYIPTTPKEHFNKAIFFLFVSIVVLFLNRFLSIIFNPNANSVFTYFAGFLINYTAVFFVIIGIVFFNLRKAFSDERFRAVFDIMLILVWSAAFFYLFFPSESIRYSFIHIPIPEFILIIIISFLRVYFKKNKSLEFHLRLAWRLLLYFMLPASVIFILKLPVRLILFINFGRLYPLMILALYTVFLLVAFIVTLIKRRPGYFLNIFTTGFFPFLAVMIYFVYIPASMYHQVVRYASILFYPVIFPVVFFIHKNKENLIKKFNIED